MNLSGNAVSYAVEKHDLEPSQIIVMHDDIDIPVGEFKISFDRGSANHNGVESVTQALGTQAYIRLRIGIGSRGPIPLKNYVLMQLPPNDLASIQALAIDVEKAIRVIAEEIGRAHV